MARSILSPEVLAVGITISKQDRTGTSLGRRLPNVSGDTIKQHFGYNFGRERTWKYSDSAHILETDGMVFALYMSFGEWRFGTPTHETQSGLYRERLNKLAILLGEETNE